MVNKIDFSQKIEKIQTEIIEEKAKTINGKYVYHYTSIAAFYGIIKNKELWLGNTSSMNDKSELLGFTSKIQSNLKKELPDKHNEIKEYFDLVSNRIRNEFPFALCFSTLNDDAAQWERYAQNATGVRIAFDIKVLLTLIQGIGFIFNEIFYDSPIKENLHYALLKNYFDTGILYEFSSEKSQIDNLILTASLHKHKSFVSEKEYRLEFLSNEIKKYRKLQ